MEKTKAPQSGLQPRAWLMGEKGLIPIEVKTIRIDIDPLDNAATINRNLKEATERSAQEEPRHVKR